MRHEEAELLPLTSGVLVLPGTAVTVLWGEELNSAKPVVERHRQVGIRATVAPAPYVREVRDSYPTS